MKRLLAAVLLLPLTISAQTATTPAAPPASLPGAKWQQLVAPEKSGWSAEGLAAVTRELNTIGSTSALIVQHGVIVAAWGDITHRSNLHSCRKSFASALIGIQAAQGKINLDQTLAQLNIDDLPPSLTPAEKQATVRELLQARSGVYHDAAYETAGMKAKRPARGSHPHGAFWYYNNWDFNVLGHLYEQAAGKSIFQGFYDSIAQPIGMQDFTPRNGHYVSEPTSRYPAYLFDFSARDFARFGLLFLHHGNWQGRQIVPADWVRQSTTPYSDTPSGGYGYLWWTADSASGAPAQVRFPAGSFWAEGHLGQYALVIPSLDMVIVNRVDPALTTKEVSKTQMAHLVQTILAAAPAAPATKPAP